MLCSRSGKSIWIRNLGFVLLISGSGSCSICVDFQDNNKNDVFSIFCFVYYFLNINLQQALKKNSSKSHKTAEIKFFVFVFGIRTNNKYRSGQKHTNSDVVFKKKLPMIFIK
jgi:hypothetical protein